jgi:hypothetical protein
MSKRIENWIVRAFLFLFVQKHLATRETLFVKEWYGVA